jgi:CBS domain containing-hemolysin-like protein
MNPEQTPLILSQVLMDYMNFKDIVAALKINPSDLGLGSITRPIKRIDEHTSLSQALEQMIRENAHIACIVQSGGTMCGLNGGASI